ncbi:hypothetical protein FFZ77_16905, partial [Streptomyces katsurahamanus]|nr:hypothetical protein [Streptomyces katsurahamanus]
MTVGTGVVGVAVGAGVGRVVVGVPAGFVDDGEAVVGEEAPDRAPEAGSVPAAPFRSPEPPPARLDEVGPAVAAEAPAVPAVADPDRVGPGERAGPPDDGSAMTRASGRALVVASERAEVRVDPSSVPSAAT